MVVAESQDIKISIWTRFRVSSNLISYFLKILPKPVLHFSLSFPRAHFEGELSFKFLYVGLCLSVILVTSPVMRKLRVSVY
jgi:hypothetical protein